MSGKQQKRIRKQLGQVGSAAYKEGYERGKNETVAVARRFVSDNTRQIQIDAVENHRKSLREKSLWDRIIVAWHIIMKYC